ncbi:MAG: cell cycle transcriptional regulator TrcR, partial [Rhodobacterales bacterium]
KPTIQAIRERTHWNIGNIQPIDPVALGLCKQSELDAAVQKASKKGDSVLTDDERRKLVSTEQSLGMDEEPRLPSSMEGLEKFSLSDPREDEEDKRSDKDFADAESFFNLPDADDEDDDEESDDPRR